MAYQEVMTIYARYKNKPINPCCLLPHEYRPWHLGKPPNRLRFRIFSVLYHSYAMNPTLTSRTTGMEQHLMP
jgi:hypothetical protein